MMRTYDIGHFPQTRLRRLRTHGWVRQMIAESHLDIHDLILPIFVREPDESPDIPLLPGVRRYTINELPKALEPIVSAGIHAIALFPCTPQNLKTDNGDEALNPENLVCRAIQQIKYYHQNLGIIADVALDPYTTHGHDGVIINNYVNNDETVAILCKQAKLLCEAGADIVAPSDMMDGRVGAIRQFLDRHKFHEKMILSYAAKFASAFYGPFRDAVGVDGLKNIRDKKTYQLPPTNRNDAMREIAQDIQEGADMIIVKPGMPYLDIIHQAANEFPVPVFAYQVSGEYALFKNIPDKQLGLHMLMESLLSFKRAGASGILTYAAMDVAEFLKVS